MLRIKSIPLFPILVLAGYCLIFQSILIAGTTGKIAGIVKDAASDNALVGANVQIEDTKLGAAAGLDGNFSILNIPPGIYTLKITMMGYKPIIIEKIRVQSDLTTFVKAELNETILTSEEVITIEAERTLIQKDMTGSLISVSDDEIENLPVTDIT
ncbi:MAG: carboxypeptidase-like regulatory domain-containing protein, partial [Calditrichaceae bacterium]|nr:carboxypeptidase-like regulatory domain-containing protein [Calditrichaceae bacterium]